MAIAGLGAVVRAYRYPLPPAKAAFNVASIVCIGIALAAAATVVWFARRTRPEAEAVVDDLDLELGLELGLVPVGVAEGSE